MEQKYTHENEQISSILLDSISDLVFLMRVEEDDKFIYEMINSAGINCAGLSLQSIGKSLEEVLPSEKSERMISFYKKTAETRTASTFEDSFQRDDSTTFGHTVLTPILDESGKCTYVLAVTRDITEQRKREIEIQNAFEILNSLMMHTGDAIIILDRSQTIIKANPGFEKLYGWREEEVLGKQIPYVPEELADESVFLLNEVLKGETISSYETVRIHKNGTLQNVSLTMSPIRNYRQEIVAVSAIMRNIDERKKAERRLLESRSKYKSLFQYNPNSILTLDLKGNITEVNPGFEEIFSFTKNEVLNISFLHLISLDDIEMARKHFQLAMTGVSTNVEVKGKRKDHKDLWIHLTFTPIIIDREITGLYAIGQDITEKKQAIDAVRDSEERYRIITEHSQDLITVYQTDGTITYASPSYKFLLGVGPAEAAGKPLDFNVHPEERRPLWQQFYESLMTRDTFTCHVRKKHLSGEWIWYEEKGTPVAKDNAEGVTHIIIVSRDITEQKKYEEELRNLAFFDHLTGIPNRRMFHERLDQALAYAKTYNEQFAVMYLDGDGFKEVNDLFGHDAGDELLKQAALRLQNSLREGDTVSRFGGDEFGILLSRISSRQDAAATAERIISIINEPFYIYGQVVKMTFSIGIACCPMDAEDARTILKHADIALYDSKEKGKNQYSFFKDA